MVMDMDHCLVSWCVWGELIRLSRDCERIDHGAEEEQTVGGAEEALAGAVRMRHHAENVTALAEHAGDVLKRAVGIRGGGDLTCRRSVTEGDTVFGFQLCQSVGGAEVVAFHVADGHLEDLTALDTMGEGRVGGLGTKMDLFADVVLSGVAHERAGKQAG